MRDLIALTAAFASVTVAAFTAGSAGRKPSSTAAHAEAPHLFETSHGCMACHNGLTTTKGEDVAIGSAWRSSMMANSARDPYWHASVRREVLDRPSMRQEIEDECSTCHMPMMRYEAAVDGEHGEVLSRLPLGQSTKRADALAADGVSCTLCHQITDRKLGAPESFSGGFVVDAARRAGPRPVFGPYEIDGGRQRVMHSSSLFVPTQGTHIRKSELCATCHTLYTNARGADGAVVGRLPEQVPFLEWQHSDYGSERAAQSCQACHMPAVAESTAIASVLGQRRPTLARHDFRGGNFFVLGMLDRYRTELGVEAPSPELAAAVRRTLEHLQTSAARIAHENVAVSGGQLRADVVLQNLTGHKLPTAYPSRRVWVHFTVRDRAGAAVFESGAVSATGAIAGNDNDADPATYEPHYREITRPTEVQIYETIMTDTGGRLTTGLLSAVDYVKDNRLLPAGFDKASAGHDIAVRGGAAGDADFAQGGDRVRYTVVVPASGGPFQVEAELRYQPIAFRWAHNLGRQRAREIDRFLSYYDAMADGSSALLAREVAAAR
jgi:hypothetical protein